MFVLAVEIHQVPPQLRQGGYRGRLAVDERFALAFAVQLPAEGKIGRGKVVGGAHFLRQHIG